MSVNLTRYALWFAGSGLVIMTLFLIIQRAFALELGSAVAPILPAMIAASIEGSKWAKSTRDPIPQPWRDAGLMTVVAIGFMAFMVLTTAFASAGINSENLRIVAILLLVYTVFWLITNRVFLGMGARNEWANQDRRGG